MIVDGRQDGEDIRPDHAARYNFAADLVLDRVKVTRARVLDFGCGTGYGARIIARRTGARVIALDHDTWAIQKAREARPDAEGDAAAEGRVAFLHGTFGYPLLAPGFDVLVAFEVLEHMEAAPRLAALQWLRRMAKGGVLLASVPNEDVVHFKRGDSHPEHTRHFTPDEFFEVLDEGGWTVTHRFHQVDKAPGLVDTGDTGRTLVFQAQARSV